MGAGHPAKHTPVCGAVQQGFPERPRTLSSSGRWGQPDGRERRLNTHACFPFGRWSDWSRASNTLRVMKSKAMKSGAGEVIPERNKRCLETKHVVWPRGATRRRGAPRVMTHCIALSMEKLGIPRRGRPDSCLTPCRLFSSPAPLLPSYGGMQACKRSARHAPTARVQHVNE